MSQYHDTYLSRGGKLAAQLCLSLTFSSESWRFAAILCHTYLVSTLDPGQNANMSAVHCSASYCMAVTPFAIVWHAWLDHVHFWTRLEEYQKRDSLWETTNLLARFVVLRQPCISKRHLNLSFGSQDFNLHKARMTTEMMTVHGDVYFTPVLSLDCCIHLALCLSSTARAIEFWLRVSVSGYKGGLSLRQDRSGTCNTCLLFFVLFYGLFYVLFCS